ncbi:uncharacterized protein EI97DRAFT_456763 [Westerdykella ornata]|uniref:Secreted protein n=1 Tax=Westerdykella ornata TaxID=318751 RepID=A0A6A6JPN9_WESOR|nr:uncharacterized protein EI97DRAFT_456763 [Westerdykella ornata]KAF2278347.1 hypothetical protein EI97DRAFT_456763 [Westerdykella ornata]
MLQFLLPVALLLSSVSSAPTSDTQGTANTAMSPAAVPNLCKPPNPDGANTYIYYDMNSHCQQTGNCKEACVSFIQSTACARDFDAVDTTYVQLATYDQIKKDGQWETSRRGPWLASFSLFTTAFPNRQAGNTFDTALTRYMNAGYPLPLNIYFNEIPVGSNQVFGMEARRDNCQ